MQANGVTESSMRSICKSRFAPSNENLEHNMFPKVQMQHKSLFQFKRMTWYERNKWFKKKEKLMLNFIQLHVLPLLRCCRWLYRIVGRSIQLHSSSEFPFLSLPAWRLSQLSFRFDLLTAFSSTSWRGWRKRTAFQSSASKYYWIRFVDLRHIVPIRIDIRSKSIQTQSPPALLLCVFADVPKSRRSLDSKCAAVRLARQDSHYFQPIRKKNHQMKTCFQCLHPHASAWCVCSSCLFEYKLCHIWCTEIVVSPRCVGQSRGDSNHLLKRIFQSTACKRCVPCFHHLSNTKNAIKKKP